jgi:hypothetical protein
MNQQQAPVKQETALAPSATRGMLQQAVSAGAQVDVIERLIALVERENAKDAQAAFNVAFAAVKRALPSLPKNGVIPNKGGGVRSRFVKRDDLHRALTPILSAHGFATSFSFRDSPPNRMICTMTLTHAGGHSETFEAGGPWAMEIPAASDQQKSGGAKSFMKRLVMMDAFDILDEDVDDDASGMGARVMVSEAAALELEDMLQECENRETGAKGRFLAWIRSEYRAPSINALTAQDAATAKGWLAKKLGVR